MCGTNAAPHLLTSLRGCRYAGVLLKYATPSLWAAIVLAMESAKDVEYDHLIFGVCWLTIIWCVVMAVAQLGLHFLHHLLTYTDSKAKRKGQRRTLVILAALHQVARQHAVPRRRAQRRFAQPRGILRTGPPRCSCNPSGPEQPLWVGALGPEGASQSPHPSACRAAT